MRLSKGAGRVFLNTVVDYYEDTGDGLLEAEIGDYVVTVTVIPKE